MESVTSILPFVLSSALLIRKRALQQAAQPFVMSHLVMSNILGELSSHILGCSNGVQGHNDVSDESQFCPKVVKTL